MNGAYLTSREAAALFEHWHERVEELIRKAATKARGRQDRHRSDLADLYRDLASVNLYGLPDLDLPTLPGTPARAVVDAVRFLDEAEQQHAFNAHKAALARLQYAYTAANLAIELADGTSKHTAIMFDDLGITPSFPALPQGLGSDNDWEDPSGGYRHIPTQGR